MLKGLDTVMPCFPGATNRTRLHNTVSCVLRERVTALRYAFRAARMLWDGHIGADKRRGRVCVVHGTMGCFCYNSVRSRDHPRTLVSTSRSRNHMVTAALNSPGIRRRIVSCPSTRLPSHSNRERTLTYTPYMCKFNTNTRYSLNAFPFPN